jgi:hypothetical protein
MYSRIMHDFSVEGWQKLPMDGPALLVSTHTTHSTDILICCLTAHKLSGRVVRGLLHRILITCMPWLRYFGLVPGYRDSAVQLLRQGNWVGVVPGGAEEISHHIGNHGSEGDHDNIEMISLRLIFVETYRLKRAPPRAAVSFSRQLSRCSKPDEFAGSGQPGQAK